MKKSTSKTAVATAPTAVATAVPETVATVEVTVTAAPAEVTAAPADAEVTAAPATTTEATSDLSADEIAEINADSETDTVAATEGTKTSRVSNKLLAGTLKRYSPEQVEWKNEATGQSGLTHQVKVGNFEFFRSKSTGDEYVSFYFSKAELSQALLRAHTETQLEGPIATLYLAPSMNEREFQKAVGRGSVLYIERPTGKQGDDGYPETESVPGLFLRKSRKGAWNVFLLGAQNRDAKAMRQAFNDIKGMLKMEGEYLRGIAINIGIQRKRSNGDASTESNPLDGITVGGRQSQGNGRYGNRGSSNGRYSNRGSSNGRNSNWGGRRN